MISTKGPGRANKGSQFFFMQQEGRETQNVHHQKEQATKMFQGSQKNLPANFDGAKVPG